LAKDETPKKEAGEITQEEADEWVRNLDSTKIMIPAAPQTWLLII